MQLKFAANSFAYFLSIVRIPIKPYEKRLIMDNNDKATRMEARRRITTFYNTIHQPCSLEFAHRFVNPLLFPKFHSAFSTNRRDQAKKLFIRLFSSSCTKDAFRFKKYRRGIENLRLTVGRDSVIAQTTLILRLSAI